MKTFVLLIFLLCRVTYADAIIEACERDMPQQIVQEIQKKKPRLQGRELKAQMEGRVPAAEYRVKSAIGLCKNEKIKAAMKSPSNFSWFCPGVKSELRIDCLREWASKQDVTYAKHMLQMTHTAAELAQKDVMMQSSAQAQPQIVIPILVDTILSQLERYSVQKNVAYRSRPGANKKDTHALLQMESKNFAKTRAILLSFAKHELDVLKLKLQKTRAPASGGIANVPSIGSLEARMKKLGRSSKR